MPTINLTRLFEIGVKVTLFLAFVAFFVTNINNFTLILKTFISNMGVSFATIDLGCFAEKIGLVSFLNSLFIIIYNAVGLYISSILTVVSFKFITKIYQTILKV